MVRLQYILLLLIIFRLVMAQSFKEEQLHFPRVKSAFAEKGRVVDSLFKAHHLDRKGFAIFLRGFKSEKRLEVWGKNDTESSYRLIRIYPFCEVSGLLGPKRKEGDGQIPEGVYTIDHFNPESNYYLSLGVSYPNRSDAILGVKGKLGGQIYIHGNCVTIGCIPITDDLIMELYVIAVEARNSGQREIPVHLFPTTMDEERLEILKHQSNNDWSTNMFWENLSSIYMNFEKTKMLRTIAVDRNGKYYLQ